MQPFSLLIAPIVNIYCPEQDNLTDTYNYGGSVINVYCSYRNLNFRRFICMCLIFDLDAFLICYSQKVLYNYTMINKQLYKNFKDAVNNVKLNDEIFCYECTYGDQYSTTTIFKHIYENKFCNQLGDIVEYERDFDEQSYTKEERKHIDEIKYMALNHISFETLLIREILEI